MVAVSLKKNFFQAEDGIRDHCVTGVQTCALPIWHGILQHDHLRRVSRAMVITLVRERVFLHGAVIDVCAGVLLVAQNLVKRILAERLAHLCPKTAHIELIQNSMIARTLDRHLEDEADSRRLVLIDDKFFSSRDPHHSRAAGGRSYASPSTHFHSTPCELHAQDSRYKIPP